MDEIFRADELYGVTIMETYRSKSIKIPKRWIMKYGLPEEVHVVVDKLADTLYVNRVTCVVFPGDHCNVMEQLPRTRESLNYDNEKSARKNASQLEIKLRQLVKEEEAKTYPISAANHPLYHIFTAKRNEHYMLIAGEINPDYELNFGLGHPFKEEYRIVSMDQLGRQKLFYPFGGPAGIIRFGIEELYPLIHEIEEELNHRYTTDDGFFINAFFLGNWTGRAKTGWGDRYELPISFYKIEVDREPRKKQ